MPLDHNDADQVFIQLAMKAELLDPATELALAYAWRDQRDEAALHRLIVAYQRLAISMARKFRRYGPPLNDLIQEANLGLMKAADKFDPDRGVRFSTYAVWWIKASIQEYAMRQWSLVRTGSSSNQKSLFFNLRRIKARIERETENSGIRLTRQEILEQIAEETGIPLRDVEMMDGRIAGQDFSLNTPIGDGDDGERIDFLEDESESGSEATVRQKDHESLKTAIAEAFSCLKEREQYIVRERKLCENPRTLESLGVELELSKERVRQLEAAALKKLRKYLERQYGKDMFEHFTP